MILFFRQQPTLFLAEGGVGDFYNDDDNEDDNDNNVGNHR
jgi:hypothetical protein